MMAPDKTSVGTTIWIQIQTEKAIHFNFITSEGTTFYQNVLVKIITFACFFSGGNVLQQVSPGKPVQLAGKPLAHAKGQILQLGGKGQQTLGVIQTPQGTINIIPQGAAQGGVVTIPQAKQPGLYIL